MGWGNGENEQRNWLRPSLELYRLFSLLYVRIVLNRMLLKSLNHRDLELSDINLIWDPFLASWFANSLPMWPEWLGTHIMVNLHSVQRLQGRNRILDSIIRASRVLKVARLSLKLWRRTPFPRSFLCRHLTPSASLAYNSAWKMNSSLPRACKNLEIGPRLRFQHLHSSRNRQCRMLGYSFGRALLACAMPKFNSIFWPLSIVWFHRFMVHRTLHSWIRMRQSLSATFMCVSRIFFTAFLLIKINMCNKKRIR